MPANGTSRDTLTTGEAAKLLRVCQQTVIKWADDGDIPSWRTSGGHRRFSAAELRAGNYAPGKKAQRPIDPKVEAWAMTLEQVMPAAADHFSATGDVRRSRMIRQVRGRLVPRVHRG
jgi:excisionase family DNA binding protein